MIKKIYTIAMALLALPAFAQGPSFAGLMRADVDIIVPGGDDNEDDDSGKSDNPATEKDVIWTPQCVTDGHFYEFKFEAGMKGFTRVGATDVKINTENGIKAFMIQDTYSEDFYIQNPLPRTLIGSYIKGQMVEGDDEEIYVECQLPQWINARESTNTGVCLSLGRKIVNPDGMVFYEPIDNEEENVIRYVMDEDENFVLSLSEDVALCAFYRYLDEESLGTFAGAAAYEVIYKEPGRKFTREIPAGVEAEDWGMLYSNDDKSHTVTVGIDKENNKIYIAGFTPDFPESCVVGTIDGDKITFEGGQFIGETDFTYEYLVFNEAKFVSTSDRGDVFNFPGDIVGSIEAVYDPEEKTVSCPMNMAWFANAGTTQLYYSSFYVGPMFLENKLGPATPVDPEIVEVMDYMPEFGYGGFLAEMPLIGTNGEVLQKDNYTYIVYFDGEPYTFYPEIYPGVPEAMTQIPYDFEDGEDEDFRVEGITHIICWRVAGFSSLGVQAVYTVDGVENRSNVVSYQLSSSVASVDADEVASEYFDLTGARVASPAQGIYVKRTILSDGTVKTVKTCVK